MAKTFFLEKRGGKLEFCGTYQRDAYTDFTGKLKDKQVIEMTLQKRRHAKTNPQLAYWYGVLCPFTVGAMRDLGYNTLFDVSVGMYRVDVATSNDTVDLLFKTLFMHHKGLEKLPLKRDMTDETMSELIEFSLTWLAENLGVTPPEIEKENSDV